PLFSPEPPSRGRGASDHLQRKVLFENKIGAKDERRQELAHVVENREGQRLGAAEAEYGEPHDAGSLHHADEPGGGWERDTETDDKRKQEERSDRQGQVQTG